jgi:hypothetical protein
MHVTVNFLGLFFRTGKIFFGLTRFSCLSVRMTDNFSASFGKSVNVDSILQKTHHTIFLRPGLLESIDLWLLIVKKISCALKSKTKRLFWKCHSTSCFSDFPKLAEKLSVIRTDRHENLVRPKNILPVRKKSPKKFTVTFIMFSLAFLEWFTLVLAIGHLISPLIFIEVKVIQFSVLFKIVYVMSFIVCLKFCCFDDLVL